MPPKAQPNGVRGRGRPKRSAAPEPTTSPVADTPKRRGRPAKTETAKEAAVVETPKQRGRPPKVQAVEPAVVAKPAKRGRPSLAALEAARVEEASTPKKRVGRPAKKEAIEEDIPASNRRVGRPSRVEAAVEEVPKAPKQRGRPARNANAPAVDLNRGLGSPRVTKSRSKPSRVPKSAPAAPHMRSTLRTRLPPAQKVKEKPAPQPTKRRGRPPKAPVAQPLSSKKAPGHTAKNAAITKPAAPRKKRGFTTVEVADKFAAQVQQYIQELHDAESLPTPDADSVEEVDAEAEAEADGGTVQIIEEEVIITSAPADAEEDGGMVISGEIQDDIYALEADVDADAGVNSNVQEESIQDEVVNDVTMLEDAEDESTEPDTEVKIQMSVQEIIQLGQGEVGVGALEQELDAENDEPHASIFDDEFAHDTNLSGTADAIFG